MELFMMRASIVEEEDITLTKLLSWLNLNIRDRFKLLCYRDLNDLVQTCIKVKQQSLRRSSSKNYQAPSASYVKRDFKKEKEEPPKKLAKEKGKAKGESSAHICINDIKCFKCLGRGYTVAQCPTKRTIIL